MKPHRQIIQEHQLALLDPEVGLGLPIWLPNGLKVRRKIENHIRARMEEYGYQEVDSPHLGNLSLYEKSGHYPYYADSQFAPVLAGPAKEDVDEGKGWLLKPMNCPHHIQVYRSQPRSYRDLPYRISEFGKVYRYEAAGSVNGLLRARAFIQDDGHVFLREEDLQDEIQKELQLFQEILAPFLSLGLAKPSIVLSLRGEGDKYVGSPDSWAKAERHAREALGQSGMEFREAPGEAAFYGPKLDFSVVDQLGRSWQLGTIQLDFNLPERFDLQYKNSDDAWVRPVMIHRAALGSLERFLAILLESCQGRLPLWLHYQPLAILPIAEAQRDYALELKAKARALGVSAEVWEDDPLQVRIAKASVIHVPKIWVVGRREKASGSVNLREGEQQRELSLDAALVDLG